MTTKEILKMKLDYIEKQHDHVLNCDVFAIKEIYRENIKRALKEIEDLILWKGAK